MAEVFIRGRHAHGTLVEQRDGLIVLALPGSDYRLHLRIDAPLDARPGDRVHGTIKANARRVDVVTSGGAYIEPVYGRPRRLQGRVLATDPAANTLTVNVGPCPVEATLMPAQKAGDFMPGMFVSFDVEPGARLDPEHQPPNTHA